MKVLSLSLDNSSLNSESKTAKRAIEYGELAERYDVIVPGEVNESVKLSEKVLVSSVGRGNKIKKLFAIYKKASSLLNGEKYDLITVQDVYYMGLIALILKNKYKIGLEIQIHGFEKFYGMRRALAGYIIPKADCIRVVSARLKHQIIKVFGMIDEKIVVAPIFTDVHLKNLELKNKSENKKFIFLTVGRLVKVKNIEMQIEAISALAEKHRNIELWIVGEGELRHKLEAKCRNLKIVSIIKFLGWQDDLEKIYSQADVFLLTSNYEGWGMVIIEAASYGLPIIMTDVGCAGEVIQNNKSGLIIPAGDKKKLIKSMEILYNNQELRDKLGIAASAALKNLPTKEETLNLYLKSWEQAVK